MLNENINRVLDINSIIDYQQGSIVSRVLVKEKTGNITLFAFDKGQELSEHTAPFDAVVHIVDGAAEVTVDGKANNLKSGQMIIMPANIPHALKATNSFKMILSMIKKPKE